MDLTIFISTTVLLFLIYLPFQQIKQQRFHRTKLDRSLEDRLSIMLGNDNQAALKLLITLRRNQPRPTYLSYHEKAIRDLLRDRRYWLWFVLINLKM